MLEMILSMEILGLLSNRVSYTNKKSIMLALLLICHLKPSNLMNILTCRMYGQSE